MHVEHLLIRDDTNPRSLLFAISVSLAVPLLVSVNRYESASHRTLILRLFQLFETTVHSQLDSCLGVPCARLALLSATVPLSPLFFCCPRVTHVSLRRLDIHQRSASFDPSQSVPRSIASFCSLFCHRRSLIVAASIMPRQASVSTMTESYAGSNADSVPHESRGETILGSIRAYWVGVVCCIAGFVSDAPPFSDRSTLKLIIIHSHSCSVTMLALSVSRTLLCLNASSSRLLTRKTILRGRTRIHVVPK